MEIISIRKKKEVVTPKIGELWKHAGFGAHYLRICDDYGKKALEYLPSVESEMFYSICLEDNTIVRRPIDSGDIEILGSKVEIVG